MFKSIRFGICEFVIREKNINGILLYNIEKVEDLEAFQFKLVGPQYKQLFNEIQHYKAYGIDVNLLAPPEVEDTIF